MFDLVEIRLIRRKISHKKISFGRVIKKMVRLMRLSESDGIIIIRILVVTTSPVHRRWREFLLHQLIVWFL